MPCRRVTVAVLVLLLIPAIGRSEEKREALERMGATTVDVTLFDAAGLGLAVAGHDAVVNLATHMPPSSLRMLFARSWSENDRVRREGSARLVHAATTKGVQRFVQESFAPVYPDRGDAWIDETVPIDPLRYNASILDAEQSAQRFDGGDRSGIVLRFACSGAGDRGLNASVARASAWRFSG